MLRRGYLLVIFVVLFLTFLPTVPAFAARRSQPESSLLEAVNAARLAHGLRPLRVDPTLTRAARAHTIDMLQRDYFAHGAFARRMAQFHVQAARIGEDLAWGNGAWAQATAVVREWLASPAHRANVLDPRFGRIGIGAASGTFQGAAGATIFTADFAGG